MNDSILQGHYIASRGWVDRRHLSIAYRLAQHRQIDLCTVLVDASSISESQADATRQAVQILIQSQANQVRTPSRQVKSLPQAVLPDQKDSESKPVGLQKAGDRSKVAISDAIETLKLNVGASEVDRLRKLAMSVSLGNIEETVAETEAESKQTQKRLAQQHAPQFFQVGGNFGDYVIQEELARGGMGVVFRAQSPKHDREVALKVILADQEAASVERFKREITVLKTLSHPGIVEMYDYGQEGPLFYYSMELFSHAKLIDVARDILARGEQKKLLRYLMDIASALEYCHAKGVIHRDVKPQNVVIDPEAERAVLIDFGIMKKVNLTDTNAGGEVTLTKNGQFVGSPAFMSPEQYGLRSFGELSEQSDVWAFGVTMFRVLTGKLPFKANDVASLIDSFIANDIPTLKSVDPQFDSALNKLCSDCMQRDQKLRPTMKEVKRRLAAIIDPPPLTVGRLVLLAAVTMILSAIVTVGVTLLLS